MKFRTTLLKAGKTATGIQIPADVMTKLGPSKRPPVRVTINGHTYRSTVAVMGGKFLVGVSAENREKAKVAGGDSIVADIELDTQPREVTVPIDLAKALARDKTLKQAFDGLSYTHRKEHVRSIEEAKTAETRQRRIAKTISKLKGKL
ncbi:MAG: YdeI/OmpD-associated family protein [Acidobacteriia bacterium]|nr:YdeI/OmpD-associated family protein [Terriglobia bacterium]